MSNPIQTNTTTKAADQARRTWGFLHGWYAAAADQPCDPPAEIHGATLAAWRDGWMIAQDEARKGTDIKALSAASDVLPLYLQHAATPKGMLS